MSWRLLWCGPQRSPRLLVFTEPNVAFAARSEDSGTIRAHLSLGSGPPCEDVELYDHCVPLELTSRALVDAIDCLGDGLESVPHPLVPSWHNSTVIGTVVPWLPK